MLWIFIALVAGVVLAMLGSYFLGPHALNKAAKVPYESGIIGTGSAQMRFPAHFYWVAVFFVIFDLESIFIYAWSVSARDLGFQGLSQIGVFISVLLLGLVYLIRQGAFNFGPKLRQPGDPA